MYSDISHQRARCFLCAALIAAVICSTAWRADADSNSSVYLPVVMNSVQQTATPPDTSPEQIALDRLNFYRTLAGSPPMQLHPALVAAAQNHTNYYLLNTNDASAWRYGPHGEVVGKPGYTGRTSGDRAAAVGYTWRAGWEVMGYVDDPTMSVDGWMATIFHRTIILDPYLEGSHAVVVVEYRIGMHISAGRSYRCTARTAREHRLSRTEPFITASPNGNARLVDANLSRTQPSTASPMRPNN